MDRHRFKEKPRGDKEKQREESDLARKLERLAEGNEGSREGREGPKWTGSDWRAERDEESRESAADFEFPS